MVDMSERVRRPANYPARAKVVHCADPTLLILTRRQPGEKMAEAGSHRRVGQAAGWKGEMAMWSDVSSEVLRGDGMARVPSASLFWSNERSFYGEICCNIQATGADRAHGLSHGVRSREEVARRAGPCASERDLVAEGENCEKIRSATIPQRHKAKLQGPCTDREECWQEIQPAKVCAKRTGTSRDLGIRQACCSEESEAEERLCRLRAVKANGPAACRDEIACSVPGR